MPPSSTVIGNESHNSASDLDRCNVSQNEYDLEALHSSL